MLIRGYPRHKHICCKTSCVVVAYIYETNNGEIPWMHDAWERTKRKSFSRDSMGLCYWIIKEKFDNLSVILLRFSIDVTNTGLAGIYLQFNFLYCNMHRGIQEDFWRHLSNLVNKESTFHFPLFQWSIYEMKYHLEFIFCRKIIVKISIGPTPYLPVFHVEWNCILTDLHKVVLIACLELEGHDDWHKFNAILAPNR